MLEPPEQGGPWSAGMEKVERQHINYGSYLCTSHRQRGQDGGSAGNFLRFLTCLFENILNRILLGEDPSDASAAVPCSVGPQKVPLTALGYLLWFKSQLVFFQAYGLY